MENLFANLLYVVCNELVYSDSCPDKCFYKYNGDSCMITDAGTDTPFDCPLIECETAHDLNAMIDNALRSATTRGTK